MRLKSIDGYKIFKNGIEASGDGINIRIALVRENVLRLCSTVRGDFAPEETFVVDRIEFPTVAVEAEQMEDAVRMSGAELAVTVHLDPFWLEVGDGAAGSFLSTPAGESLEWSGEKATQRFDLPNGVRVYGLGQGTERALDLRDRERRMWQQWDGFRYNGNGGIPFMVSSQGYGLLLNSSWASRFAIGRARPAESTVRAKPQGPWKADQPSGEGHPQRFAVLTEGGDLDLFVIRGPDYRRIIEGYAWLTGLPPLPPKWALGWIQSKNRYKSQEQLLQVGREYRRRNIPCDALVIDWCWFELFGSLEWVRRYWPDPAGMARELNASGFHILQAQHPYMHPASPHFKEFNDHGYLISWDPAEVPDNWPPDGIRHAVDFSNPEARRLWWRKIEPLFRQGIEGYWTDMGELETHPPGCSPHHGGPREKVHNIYSTLWTKALYEGQRSMSDRRVFCLARTAYAGIQRYGAALWSGDIDPSWEVLEDQVVIGQQVCLSGQPYWTTDIGGFMTTELYQPELYVRWLQWGAFCPVFRTHGTRPENEPWSFGPEAEQITAECIRRRYRLMPYIYSLAYETSQSGLSMMRAMMVEFPEDREAAVRDHQFMFGPFILVAPVTGKGVREKKVWLPAGRWYGYYDDRKYVGPREVSEPAPLWKIPLFVRGGSIIPMGRAALHTGEGPLDPLILHIYPGRDARFSLYEDDGLTYSYEKGARTLTEISYAEESRTVEISAARGEFSGFPAGRSVELIVHDCACPETVRVNQKTLDPGAWRYVRAGRRLEIRVDRRAAAERLVVELQGEEHSRDDGGPPSGAPVFAGCDLEGLDPQAAGHILRVYLDNTGGKEGAGGKTLVRMPLGWSCEALDGRQFNLAAGERSIQRFRLTAGGECFTAESMASVGIRSPRGQESRKIRLGSGWATWWTLAGPYRTDGPEGFDTVYAPERSGDVSQENLEPGTEAVFFRGFECFGYVNLEKIFAPRDITEMVAAAAEYKLCYASCSAESPEQQECLLQLMGEDRFKVWINGRLLAVVSECGARPVEYPVRLRKGSNRVLLKCTQDAHREWNDRSWGFFFRFADEERKPLKDVIYSCQTK